jgi:hypothetical protein
MNYPAAEQRSINRNIYNRPKGGELMRLRRIKPLSAGILADLSAVFFIRRFSGGGGAGGRLRRIEKCRHYSLDTIRDGSIE